MRGSRPERIRFTTSVVISSEQDILLKPNVHIVRRDGRKCKRCCKVREKTEISNVEKSK